MVRDTAYHLLGDNQLKETLLKVLLRLHFLDVT
jgi:hypothetical protein